MFWKEVWKTALFALAIGGFGGVPQAAGAGPAAQAQPGQARGPVTNLPLPRFVSLKVDEANIRRGPSLAHRIDWVFTARGMPLLVIGEYGNWRRVQDRDGVSGWVHYSLLSGVRTVIIEQDMLPLYQRRDPDSPVAALLEAGVIARLEECGPVWCRLSAGGQRGWTTHAGMWGVAEGEVVE